MAFRFAARLAVVALGLLMFSGCGNSSSYSGTGLPQGYKPYSHAANSVVELDTTAGKIKIELFEDRAANTVDNFIELVESKYYDGTPFHRIVKDFMVQGGDKAGTGSGSPGYTFDDEIDPENYKLDHYSVAMANRGKDPQTGKGTNGSQFFIVTNPDGAHHLDGKHTLFGKVIEGMDVVDQLNLTPCNGETPVTPPKILSARVVSKRPDHEYKLAASKKKMDAGPIILGPGTYSPEDINKAKQKGQPNAAPK